MLFSIQINVISLEFYNEGLDKIYLKINKINTINQKRKEILILLRPCFPKTFIYLRKKCYLVTMLFKLIHDFISGIKCFNTDCFTGVHLPPRVLSPNAHLPPPLG